MTLESKAIWIGICGLVVNVVLSTRSQLSKAKENNIKFPWKLFWIDLGLQSLGSGVLIAMGAIALDDIVDAFSKTKYLPLKVLAGFVSVGYMGASIADNVFGVVRKRINSAISYKTTIADEATGNTDAPTPASKPTPHP